MWKKSERREMQNLTNASLIEFRNQLQKFIKNVGSNDEVSFVKNKDEISFLKQYKDYIKITHNPYPCFIFDEYDEGKFARCANYLNSGHTLLETENYYKSIQPKLSR